jgi:L-alanine-DL-glutamate epimerase-like enolase superfamily enzyme
VRRREQRAIYLWPIPIPLAIVSTAFDHVKSKHISMKIVQIEWFPIAPTIASGADVRDSVHQVKGIVVCVRVKSGVVGVGEVVIDNSSVEHTFASVSHWLDEYATSIAGATVTNINAINMQLDNVSGRDEIGHRAARAAFEIAIYDLIGKIRGCPVHEVLGGGYRQDLDMLWKISPNAEKPAEDALAAIQLGYAGVKLELADSHSTLGLSGVHTEQKIVEIRAVLDAVGAEPYVDVVARQSLGNVARASMLVEEIIRDSFRANFALQQPLHKLDLMGHSQLRKKLPVPIILDESITSPAAIIQAVRLGATDRIVLDIWRVGGLQNAMRIANICESAAIGVSVSGRCCTSVGKAAICHLAASIQGNYPISFVAHGDSGDSHITGGPDVLNGRAVFGEASGLGIDLDPAWARASAATFQKRVRSI